MYDKEYIDFLVHFHCDRDYFECHEILEEHWKKDPPKKRKSYWVGLIQIAVGLYHQRRGNFAGALKMISNALRILTKEQLALSELGLHSNDLLKQLKIRKAEILEEKAYYSINLPISDENLLALCMQKCEIQQIPWGKESNLTDDDLIHKHKNRDRKEVIEERLKQLAMRKEKRKDTK